MTQASPVDVVYRGPFQSRRIRLILDTLEQLKRPLFFYWIDPKKVEDKPPDFFNTFLEARSSLVGGVHLRGAARSTPDLLRSLRSIRPGKSELAVAIGFTALAPARLLRPRRLAWCINGVPEERLLYDDGRRSRASVTALWQSARIGRRPDVAITVSKPMSALVRSRVGIEPVFELTTAVDRTAFQPHDKDDPPLLNYTGSGAPWQNLELLGAIWQQIAAQHDEARFLVVSRDDRARIAIEGLPPERAEMMPGYGDTQVAELTAGASLGFVVRQPHLVNEVSFPTKFGEYVAAGTEVITTDIGWDLARVVEKTGCGQLVDWRAAPAAIAEQVVDRLDRQTELARATACAKAADEMDRDRWIERVGRQLVDVLD